MAFFRNVLLITVLAALAGCGSTHTGGDPDAGSIMFDLDGAIFPDTPPEPDAARGAGNVGAACTGAGDCMGAADICLPDQPELIPGGYCSAECDPTDDTSCPDGSACLEVGMGQAFCFAECDPGATTRPCRAGYGCSTNFMIFPSNVCVAGCFDASDCEAGQECDPRGGVYGSGTCFDPGATIGGACTDSSECPMGGNCNPEDPAGWPGGACLGGGCDSASGSGCTGDAVCLPAQFGGGVCADGCMTDTDCRPEYACRPNATYPDRMYCAPACASDSECSVAGNVCNVATGLCAPPFDAGRLGGTCSGREPCEGGTCFGERDTGYPAGYCAYVGCEVGVAGSCPSDGVCATRGTRNVCFDGCATAMDCREGYSCRPSDPSDAASPLACLPACANDDQCPSRSTICNVGTGFCALPFDPDALGNACASAAECVGGTCLTEEAAGWPSGTCGYAGCRLSGMGPSSPCPMGSVCIDDAAGDAEIGICVSACADGGATCRSGYACRDGACRPACEAMSCGAGRTCDMASGLCRAP